MRYFKEEMDTRRAVEREELLEQQNEGVFHLFFSSRREFLDCMAARKAILNYFEGSPLTVQNLEDAVAVDMSLYKMLPRQTEAQDREKLEQAIKELLAGGGSKSAVEHEVRKFPYKTVLELVAWRDKLVRIKQARESSPEELRQIIKATAPSQWKPVPEIYQNRSMLISLANENVNEFKTLVRKCGQAQINAILQKRD